MLRYSTAMNASRSIRRIKDDTFALSNPFRLWRDCDTKRNLSTRLFSLRRLSYVAQTHEDVKTAGINETPCITRGSPIFRRFNFPEAERSSCFEFAPSACILACVRICDYFLSARFPNTFRFIFFSFFLFVFPNS